jgi:hypothetical protein
MVAAEGCCARGATGWGGFAAFLLHAGVGRARGGRQGVRATDKNERETASSAPAVNGTATRTTPLPHTGAARMRTDAGSTGPAAPPAPQAPANTDPNAPLGSSPGAPQSLPPPGAPPLGSNPQPSSPAWGPARTRRVPSRAFPEYARVYRQPMGAKGPLHWRIGPLDRHRTNAPPGHCPSQHPRGAEQRATPLRPPAATPLACNKARPLQALSNGTAHAAAVQVPTLSLALSPRTFTLSHPLKLAGAAARPCH